MPKTIEKTVYTFKELLETGSEKAKDRARLIRLLKSKQQSFSWGSSYGEKFTPEAKAWYDRSANILFSGVPYLSTAQVLAVYDHAIKAVELSEVTA